MVAVIGGDYATSLTRHVWEIARVPRPDRLHVHVLSGRDPHHIVEAQFKAFARALRDAAALDPRVAGYRPRRASLNNYPERWRASTRAAP